MNAYQEATRATAIYPKEQAIEYLSLGLASEAGEVAGKVKKRIRDNSPYIAETADELGDVLWYVARLADELGYSLDSIATENIEKLTSRAQRGVLKGSGDAR